MRNVSANEGNGVVRQNTTNARVLQQTVAVEGLARCRQGGIGQVNAALTKFTAAVDPLFICAKNDGVRT